MHRGTTIGRRAVLRAGGASLVVVAFDPTSRTWISAARAQACPFDPGSVPLPPLDGELSFEPDDLQAAADDFGHIVQRSPVAVLRPASVQDVATMVRFCREHGLSIAMRGQGHCQFGEAQVDCGIVVDSRGLAAIEEIGTDYAVVQAGVLWSELVNAAFAEGLTPPVLTDYLELSIGGTLSVGGIGGSTLHDGVQADNVLELEVVTGRGKVVTCSPWRRPFLFRSVLAGLGQAALIVRAKVRLVPAHASARVYLLFYEALDDYLADQRLLLSEDRFRYLEGQVLPSESGVGWRYMIEAAEYYTAPDFPPDAALLSGLSDDVGSRQVSDVPYLDFAFRLAPLVQQLMQLGVWAFPHPWLSLWVPSSQAESYLQAVFDDLTLEDTGQGPILLYPVRRSRVGLANFRLPDEEISFAFNVLKTAPPVPEAVDAMVVHNRTLYDALASVGGTRYAIGALPFDLDDWKAHFGPVWLSLLFAKFFYDPDRVLTPALGIFPS